MYAKLFEHELRDKLVRKLSLLAKRAKLLKESDKKRCCSDLGVSVNLQSYDLLGIGKSNRRTLSEQAEAVLFLADLGDVEHSQDKEKKCKDIISTS